MNRENTAKKLEAIKQLAKSLLHEAIVLERELGLIEAPTPRKGTVAEITAARFRTRKIKARS